MTESDKAWALLNLFFGVPGTILNTVLLVMGIGNFLNVIGLVMCALPVVYVLFVYYRHRKSYKDYLAHEQ